MGDNKELNEEMLDQEVEETTEDSAEVEAEVVEETPEVIEENTIEDSLAAIRNLKNDNKKLENEVEALKDRLLRLSAEYENYRKRTTKEKEGIYSDACQDILKEVIPMVDNLERAMQVEGNIEDFKKGIEMTVKGVATSFEKLGVEEIDTTQGFDPNMHQAVMHIQDENLPQNSIAEVFLKGYKKGDKVIRYTMVKVAN